MAGTSLEAVRTNVGGSISRMTAQQRLTLGGAFVAIVVVLFAISRLAGQTPMETLYADLDPTAAAAIVDELGARGVEYEIADNGRVVKVPADQVHEMRLALSSQGLPDLGTGGWSVLDNQGITTSEFDQRVGYQRALEGELAKTIAVIDGIQSANVHLVIPENDLFVGDDIAASASVLLQTGGRPVTESQVFAIVNLVSGSVKGMTPERVSVTDETGRVLAAPGADGAVGAGFGSDDQSVATTAYQATLETEIENLLSAIVGTGHSVVTVTAELDFDDVSTVTEEYIPALDDQGDQTMTGETTRYETYRTPDAQTDDGVLSIEDQILADDEAIAAGDLLYRLSEQDADYAINKVVTSAEQAPGAVTDLSIAVLVDDGSVDAAQLADIETLVSAAAGLDGARGDTIAVTALPFDETVLADLEAAAAADTAATGGLDLVGLIRTVGTILVTAAVLFIALRKVRKGSHREVVESIDLAALPAGSSDDDEDDDDENEDGVLGSRRPHEETLAALLTSQPTDVANVLRGWLAEEANA